MKRWRVAQHVARSSGEMRRTSRPFKELPASARRLCSGTRIYLSAAHQFVRLHIFLKKVHRVPPGGLALFLMNLNIKNFKIQRSPLGGTNFKGRRQI